LRLYFRLERFSICFLPAEEILTVHSKIPECRASCPLYFDIWTLQKKQNGFKGITVNFTDICMLVSVVFIKHDPARRNASLSKYFGGADSRGREHLSTEAVIPSHPRYDPETLSSIYEIVNVPRSVISANVKLALR